MVLCSVCAARRGAQAATLELSERRRALRAAVAGLGEAQNALDGAIRRWLATAEANNRDVAPRVSHFQ